MSIVPNTLRLTTAICWSGSTMAELRLSRFASRAWACARRSTWPSPIEASQSSHGFTMFGRSCSRPGDRGDELRDRRGERAGHEDEDQQEDRDDRGVDQDGRHDPRQTRDDRADPRDDRADDEREQPREEERQEDVAEVEEDRGQLPDDDEEERDDGQHEDGVDQPTIPSSRLDTEHRQRRPIFSRTSAIVASAMGRIRSAPSARIRSIRSGSAISSRYRSRGSA